MKHTETGAASAALPKASAADETKALPAEKRARPVGNGRAGTAHATCLDCAAELKGAFCYHCGQRRDTRRLSVAQLFRDAAEKIVNVESRFAQTLLAMFRRPGVVVREYVDGARTRYAHPLKYFLLITAACVLLWSATAWLGWWDLNHSFAGSSLKDRQMKQYIHASRAIYNLWLVVLTAVALSGVYWRSRYNVAEHFVFSLFVMGQAILLYMLFETASNCYYGQQEIGPLLLADLLLSIGYLTWAGRRFYEQRLLIVLPKMILVVVLMNAGMFLSQGLFKYLFL